ncbi:hypothetical protein JAAARDRAFT_39948 [Jaapia argillacea MUCL 33604]|uniref:Uncharacterized protein n=1 Tax=Jaapia argillacea MUCL 33604 TaxID=933084 RepID=A0A067PCM6_9AGAM|nr:hypothetical protein JAAARDRAFT_39948 [Jaapia argillacea MUCL 33604]
MTSSPGVQLNRLDFLQGLEPILQELDLGTLVFIPAFFVRFRSRIRTALFRRFIPGGLNLARWTIFDIRGIDFDNFDGGVGGVGLDASGNNTVGLKDVWRR